MKIGSDNVKDEYSQIVVDHDYWLNDSKVMVSLFCQFKADGEYHKLKPELKPDWEGARVFANDDSPELPGQLVSWCDAVICCNWISWKLNWEPCYKISKSKLKPRGRGADQGAGRI